MKIKFWGIEIDMPFVDDTADIAFILFMSMFPLGVIGFTVFFSIAAIWGCQ